MNARRSLFVSVIVCALAQGTLSAADQTPVPTPAPVPKDNAPKPLEIKDLTFVIPTFTPAEWERFLVDFQGDNVEKQKVATQALNDSGARGFNEVTKFLTSPNADLAKRAKQLQAAINLKSFEHFSATTAYMNKVESAPLTVPALKDLQKAWIATATYSSAPPIRQESAKQANTIQQLIHSVEAAQVTVEQQDKLLTETPEVHKLQRASILLDKAKALKTLRRHEEIVATVNKALDMCGPQWRQKSAALRLLIESSEAKLDSKMSSLFARRILAEHPHSLDAKFAYDTLVSSAMADGQWAEAFQLLKSLYAVCSLDTEVNDRIFSVLNELHSEHREYTHVAAMSEWICTTLSQERLTPETLLLAGNCSEYVIHDYVKSEKYYRQLGDVFSDVVDPKDLDVVLARIKRKAEGKFPKEPTLTEEGVAGVFAKFLKAIRTRDFKTAAALAPKDEVDQYESGENVEGLIAGLTFADFILQKVTLDEKGERATLTIDLYEADSNTPKPLTQIAIKEDGVWKILWNGDEEKNKPASESVEGAQPVPVPEPAPVATPVAPTGK
jgi:hypothetical protein